MITMKLKIQNEIDVKEIQRQFSILVRYSYNRLLENKSETEIINLCKSLNTINLDVSIISSAFKKAKYLIEIQKSTNNKSIIFGGKLNFENLSKNKITKQEYKLNRLMNIFSIGKSGDICGNRKFQLDLTNNKVIFKPNRHNHINIELPKLSKNQKYLLHQIQQKALNHEAPITYELNNNYIYIIFDESYCKTQTYSNFKSGRILSLDVNPNYIGLTICDYLKDNKQKIIHKEIISNKLINDIDTKGLNSSDKKNLYKTNKHNHESIEIAKYISKLAEQKHCEYVVLEDLNIKSKNHNKGKKYNKLVNNNWNRNKLMNSIKKWCTLKDIKIREVPPQYSSFIGCMQHDKEYDSIAASLELNRRAFYFIETYITKKQNLTGNIIYPKIEKKLILNKWKDESLTAKDFFTWIDLYSWFKKNPKLSYRITLSPEKEKSFRLFSNKSKLIKFDLLKD